MITSSLIQPICVWLRRGALDYSLASGADPATSPELARRARKLASRRHRAGLAASVRNLIDAAEEPRRGFSAVVPVRRDAILSERELLLELAADLESEDELNPRGIALVERLITHGDSPVYFDGNLGEELHRARAALFLA
jgi:hypothetical protein